MEIHSSTAPAEALGDHISNRIAQGDSICFLAGGSALDVIEYITVSDLVRTIFMLGDERWSRAPDVNNFLQLRERYAGHPMFTHATVIDTSVRENEDLAEFSTRLNFELKKIFSAYPNLQKISLQGIGADGHTASIFPMDQESFQATYEADSYYVPVHHKGLRIDSRASLTPKMTQRMDQVLGYATGESKLETLQKLVHGDEEIHEMPAQLIKQHPRGILYTDVELLAEGAEAEQS